MKKFKVKFEIEDSDVTAEEIIEFINDMFVGTKVVKLTVTENE